MHNAPWRGDASRGAGFVNMAARPVRAGKPRSRLKVKGRREGGSFVLLPHAVMDSSNWRRCSATAIKLLCDLARQYNGRNNGDLTAALSTLRARGWSSPETLTNAYRELLHYGLILLTRQGGLHACSLYALTWQPIDECGGKLDCSATSVPPGDWKQPVTERFRRPPKKRRPPPCAGSAAYATPPGPETYMPATPSVAKAGGANGVTLASPTPSSASPASPVRDQSRGAAYLEPCGGEIRRG